MSKKAKSGASAARRNKKYVPRPARPGGGLQLIGKMHIEAHDRQHYASKLTEDERKQLLTACWLGLADMKTGAGTHISWSHVGAALNLAMLLAEQGIGEDLLAEIIAAQQALYRAEVRHKMGKAQSYRLDAEGFKLVSEGLRTFDSQLDHVTRAELKKAHDEVARRIAANEVFQFERLAA